MCSLIFPSKSFFRASKFWLLIIRNKYLFVRWGEFFRRILEFCSNYNGRWINCFIFYFLLHHQICVLFTIFIAFRFWWYLVWLYNRSNFLLWTYMKFYHGQHVNPLSTLLGSKSYFLVIMFGIILFFFKIIPPYHSFFFLPLSKTWDLFWIFLFNNFNLIIFYTLNSIILF